MWFKIKMIPIIPTDFTRLHWSVMAQLLILKPLVREFIRVPNKFCNPHERIDFVESLISCWARGIYCNSGYL